MKFITAPFSSFLLFLYHAFSSYGWAILAFGLVVKLIMLPFQMKSKHSMMRTTMLQPRMKELEKKYATNKQKYQEEVSKLYKEAKVNPMSGCLWTLIPFPILIALYQVVRQPLSKLMSLTADQITSLTNVMVNLGLYTVPAKTDAYAEMTLANLLHENFSRIVSQVDLSSFAAQLQDINFTFLGLNLTDKPHLQFWSYAADVGWFVAIALFLLPFISAGLTWLQSVLTQKMQPAQDEKTAQTTKTMNLMMPLMSVYICFIMPAAMGIYWIEQSVLGIIQEAILNRYYKGKLDAEMAEFNAAQRKKDEELERKRQETERLKAEGRTQLNASTSKKKLAAAEKNAEEQRLAAKRAAERAARGLDQDVPDSQVDTRRYARGRAYTRDRFEGDDSAAASEADAAAEETVSGETAAPATEPAPESGAETAVSDAGEAPEAPESGDEHTEE